MNALSPASRVLCPFMACGAVLLALPLAAQVSNTYTAPPPPGYPASGPLNKQASAKASRNAAAAVQTPSTYPAYPNSYPPPPGYTYPPPPPGYGPPTKASAAKAPAAKTTSKTKTASSSKKTAGPPPPPSAKPKVYGPTGDITQQVEKIVSNDKIQNLRLGELERDVSSIKRGGKSGGSRYDGGSDIAPYTSYVARPGDNLFRIASTHRVSVGEIQQLNRMTEDEVHVGQTLLIPSPHRASSSGASTTQASYRPATPGGTVSSAAPAASAGPQTVRTASTYYTVKKGDSLKAIAIKHKMTTAALASANKLKDANKIVVGQRLTIPGKTIAAAARPATRTPQPAADHGDTVPLPGFAMPRSEPEPAPGQGLTPAPAPPSEAPPAPSKPAANYADSHRGILAYRVDRSDTIETIAQQFSTTPERIREMNRLDASTALKSGDEIMVPAMGAVSVAR